MLDLDRPVSPPALPAPLHPRPAGATPTPHPGAGAPRRILVLGGAGFIGRHAVDALIADGAAPVIGSRHPHRIGHRLPRRAADCERRQVRMERLLHADDWQAPLAGIDAVVNCVGILRSRGRETYDRVHHRGPAALAHACVAAGIPLVHVSALGLEGDVRSGFLRSKRDGEAALRASGVRGCLVRPSLLDAEHDGYGAMWLRRVARWPLLVLPADAIGRIAALDVRDLGEALANLALRTHDGPLAELDLGGPDALPLADYLVGLRRGYGLAPAPRLGIPGWLARIGAHACDLVHATPFSFGHWELLRRDNAPAFNALPGLLGRAPRPVVHATHAATPALLPQS